MPNFEDDSGNCHAPDSNGVACYKSRIGCPIHPRQKRKCHECSELSALRLDNDRLRAENKRVRAEMIRVSEENRRLREETGILRAVISQLQDDLSSRVMGSEGEQ